MPKRKVFWVSALTVPTDPTDANTAAATKSESWSLRSMMVPCLFGIANQRHKRTLPVCLERPPESRGKPAFAPSLEQQSILDSDKSKQFSKINVQSGLFDFRMTVTPETATLRRVGT